jgi:adenosylhomocysteine nucleosidase
MDVGACYAVARVNTKRTSSLFAALIAVMLLLACAARETARPIVVQGAMDVEIRNLAAGIQNATEETVGGWTFWRGTIDGYPVVISKTLKGMSNAAAATAIAAERYHPIAIINQGTAGGHVPELHVADIVLGTESVNIGSFKTGARAKGAGSDGAEWAPMDLMRSEGSAGNDPRARQMRRYPGDAGLLDAARRVRGGYQQGRVVDGVLGSSEVWNSEIDRIQAFHDRYGTSVEEMEAASAAQVAGQFQIPFLGIRVVSNNITNGEPYDKNVGEACQAFVLDVVKAYIEKVKR